jgi:hypothetical protein
MGAVIIFPVWIIFFYTRKNLRKEMIALGLFVAFWAPLFEFGWFLKDYWNPLEYVSVMSFIIQECIFGFLFGGITSVFYKVVARKNPGKGELNTINIILSIAVLLCSFLIFTNIVGLNSIYSNFIGFIALVILILFRAPDLLGDMFISGICMGAIAMIGYTILLNIYPNLITDWWMTHNICGIYLIGIPIEEIVWFFMFGLSFGAIYEFWKRPIVKRGLS